VRQLAQHFSILLTIVNIFLIQMWEQKVGWVDAGSPPIVIDGPARFEKASDLSLLLVMI
jgi:hypothetical protein